MADDTATVLERCEPGIQSLRLDGRGNPLAVTFCSRGLDTGDFVFFSGITGTRPDLSIANDAESQFRDAFRFLGANLTQAGLRVRDIVEVTTYHVGLKPHLSAFMRVKDEFIAEPYPSWTAVGVSELITDGALVEIRAPAAERLRPDRSPKALLA